MIRKQDKIHLIFLAISKGLLIMKLLPLTMNLDKLTILKKGATLEINGYLYKVIDINRGITSSNDIKEFILVDKDGDEYLLQLVMNKSINFWRIENDPLLKSPFFGESNLIEIESISLNP